MAKKQRGGSGHVPKGNQSHFGPAQLPQGPTKKANGKGAPAAEQAPNHRLGNYATAGEHAIEQPDGKQGPNQ